MRQIIFSALACLFLIGFCSLGVGQEPKDKKKPPAKEPAVDAVSQQASKLEAELGKLRDSSSDAAKLMLELVDLYHANGRVFGLIRIGQRFSSNHPTHPRHADVMLRLLDGLRITSRNKETVATCRQFLLRYAEHAKCQQVEEILAGTLDQMKDRAATAEAYEKVWRRQPNTVVGKQAAERAVSLFGGINNRQSYARAAQLAEAVVDKLPASEFTARFGWQAVYQHNRSGQYAKSNQAANKLLKKGLPKDKQSLRDLHTYMADNYLHLGQRTNAVASFGKARAIDDSFYLHGRMITELYNGAGKAAQLEPLVNEYFQKYLSRQDRFYYRAYVAHAYLREGNKPRGLAVIRELLPHDARSHSITSTFVRENGAEPAQLKQTEQVLLSALAANKNQYDQAVLRYSLAFELYRDRMKDLNKTRQMLRQLIDQSPTNDSYTQQPIYWLLYNPASDAEFAADLKRIITARRKNIEWTNLRSYLPAWIKQARSNKEHRGRAQQAKQQLTAADNDPLVKTWYASESSKRGQYEAACEKLISPQFLPKLNDDQARYIFNRLGGSYLSYGNNNQRAKAVPVYGAMVKRFPKDYSAAYSYLYAAASYGAVESAQDAAGHVLSLEPERHGSNYEIHYRLMYTAERAKDAALAKRAYDWIRRCQEKHGMDVRYADSIGDYLAKYNLKQEALDYWRKAVPLDPNNWYSRSCAGRVAATLEGDARKKYLTDLAAIRSDYHGVYAMWLADDYLKAGDLANFKKTLMDNLAVQRQRPFRGWGMEDGAPGTWVSNYRSNKEASDADKRLVFTTVRDLGAGRADASAHLALLELGPAEGEKQTPIERLLAYQRASTMIGDNYHDWDWLVGYAQAAMAKKDYTAVAALVGGMLENVTNNYADRRKAGRDMVAQSYARMGTVGLAIDENSPIAPLMQAALYLRLGDRNLAYDTYAANRALFDKHRDELPVDLVLFVCDSHIAAGGDANHDRAEDILRGWLVKFSEAKDLEDSTKAQVQLLLAKNYYKAQRYEVARSEYLTVKNRYPETPQAVEAEFGIGECYMAQKVYDQAEQVFETLAASRDREVVIRAQFLRGVLANRRGDRDEAREIFRSVLDMVPNIDLANEALFNLAEVYGAEERYIDQLELLRTVGRLGRRSKRWHHPGLSLSIVVYDPDLGTSRQHGRIPVIVTTVPGGDVETLYLYTTTGGGKGLFRADLETRLGQVSKNDRVLQVTGRDTIQVDYPDEFKKEFKTVPLSDAEIRIASGGKLRVSSSKIVDEEKETLTQRLQREAREEEEADERRSQNRPTNQIKPGNVIYMRVEDADRDLSDEIDKITIKLTATSGDQVGVELTETGPHSGVFEANAKTAELPAGALASNTAIDHSPLMAIDKDKATFWLSEPDGATPKWLSVDMKDLKMADRVVISSPDPQQQTPVRGSLLGSHDGRFWFTLGTVPAAPPEESVAGEFGRMKLRLYQGNYTGYATWRQVVDLSKNGKPSLEEEVDALSWSLPEDDENAKTYHAALWHGKFFQPRSRGVRFSVTGTTTGIMVDGEVKLPVRQGNNRTVDVWLDRGTHDLTIFSATSNPVTGVSAARAREDHNVTQVVLAPFHESDFDLKQPGAKPALPRQPTQVTADAGVWDFRFDPYELRHVKLVVDEYIGEAVAINHVEITAEDGEERHIPTQADLLSLANNNILEIAAGDTVVAAYTDEFTATGHSQLLTSELVATYFNAGITPIAYDLVRLPGGGVNEIRKQLIRVDPGEKFVVEITDYDMDVSGEPDSLRFRVALNDGEPIELVAQENSEYSGVFVKEVFTSDKPEEGKLAVKPGDRIYCTYLDTQNTFPGHAVPRETVVYVNEPAEGRIRVVETRFIRPEEGSQARPQTVYLSPEDKKDADAPAKVAFEAPLTVEVYDRDAAKDSRSKLAVQLTTSDGAKLDVECVISGQYGPANPTPGINGLDWALVEGRFVGQVILQLGSKASPSLVPLTADMPRSLVGGPVMEEEDNPRRGVSLVTRVLNLTGKDIITAKYKDLRRPAGGPLDLSAPGRLIANGLLACTGRDYEESVNKLHVGEKMFLRVVDADLDSSDARDVAQVIITTQRGEKETVKLVETLAHSGVFTGSVTLKPAESPTAGNLNPDQPVIESFFGDTINLEYLDKAASTESGELSSTVKVPVVIGTDGLVASFSKTFTDEKLAVETQFHIAESYFELFKSHRKLARKDEEQTDLQNGRRVLREVMEDYPNPKYTPRIAYLLGQFAQELQQWDEAIDSYRIIVRRFPDHTLAADAQFKLAQCYEEAEEFDQALEAYVTLAATYPKSPLIANVMTRIMEHFYAKEKNYEVAAQVGKKFLEKFEGHEWAPKVAFRVGQAYYKSEKFTDASSSFDEFAKIFPDDALASDAIFWSGESFRLGRNNPEAFRRYNMCRWKFPASDAAKYARGRLALPEMIQQFENEARGLEDQ